MEGVGVEEVVVEEVGVVVEEVPCLAGSADHASGIAVSPPPLPSSPAPTSWRIISMKMSNS